MYHNLIVPDQCDSLWQTCRELVPDLLQNCPVKTKDLRVSSANPISPQLQSVYLVTEGVIYETFDGQLIVIHEKGDLINADSLAQPKATTYETDFAAKVDEYDGQQLLDGILADKSSFATWNRYLSCLSQSYQILMCHFSRQDTELLPEFRHYEKDDVIIEENSEGDEVFTMLSGSARVVSNNEEVGEVNKDEIFGAIAALTNTKRNATIIATTDCEILVAKGENFRSLVSTRPDIAQKLIQDMARTIVSSNARIIELAKERS